MARKQYREAAKTAVIIANEEQINGENLFSLLHFIGILINLENTKNFPF